MSVDNTNSFLLSRIFTICPELILIIVMYFFSELKSPTIHLIREIYDGENAMDTFIAELDRALVAKYDYIIIEPSKLGDETSRWINVGNCLHQTAVLSGLASIATSKSTPFCIVL